MNRNPRTASETDNPARVFIVDDHPVIYEGLARLIGNEPDMTVCGGAEGASAARAKLGESRPDAVVVDLALKEGTGLELIKDLGNVLRYRLASNTLHDPPIEPELQALLVPKWPCLEPIQTGVDPVPVIVLLRIHDTVVLAKQIYVLVFAAEHVQCDANPVT